MKKFIKISVIILLILAVGSGAGAFLLYKWASEDLPGFTRITDYKPPLVTTVYTKKGEILGYFYREKRFLVTLDEIPKHLTLAFLAAEDSAFYQHKGVDLMSILRAAYKNFKSGRISQGGSTITQQIIKRLLLTSEKRYERKLKEAILAYRLENYLTKDEILTIYFNQIYLGARSYGIEAAARAYFGKHVGELTLAESAVLAGLPQAPSKYDPYRFPDKAKIRQKYVLNQMLEQEWISPEEYEKALAEPLVYKAMADISWKQGAYFLEEVRRWLIEYLSEENMKKLGLVLDRYGEDAVYESGLHVYTTVDLEHQRAAERSVKAGLEASTKRRGWRGPVKKLMVAEFNDFLKSEAVPVELLEPGEWVQALVQEVKPQGAVVKVGNQTGYIGVDTMKWCREPDPRKVPEYVPPVKDATKVVEPGDVVWASVRELDEEVGKQVPEQYRELIQFALEQRPEIQGALVSIEPPTGEVKALVGGYSFELSQFNRATQASRQPGSAFKPIVYSAAMDNGFTPASIVVDAPSVFHFGGKVWKPGNFSGKFFGPTLLRTALAKSRNVVTIRIAERIGVQTIIDRAKALGLEPEFPVNLSISLGSVAVTPINLAQAYTAFARGGTTVKPRLVLGMKMAWGEEIPVPGPEIKEAISPQNAYIITSLLKEVVCCGTGTRAKALGRPLAGKTGTTNDEMDGWFMGFTPYLLSGCYIGFDTPRPMGKFEVGGKAALPIWLKYRMDVESNYPVQDFKQPEGVVKVLVDGKTGGRAGSGSEEVYDLPFLVGTEPTGVRSGVFAGTGGGDGADPTVSAEDLLKQID